MRTPVVASLLLAALAVVTAPPYAVAETSAGPLSVENAWMRKPPGADTAAVYMVLKNTSTQSVTVVGVSSPVAHHVMVHATSTVAGQSRMRAHERVDIAPGQSVIFAPGAMHVMLSGFTRAVAVGEKVPLILLLANGERLQVSALVRPLDAQ